METAVLVQENLYLVLIVIGAVVVGLQASGRYSTPLPDRGITWAVDGMKARDLCGKRRYTAGYLVYLLPILLIYLLLAVSPELLALSMGIAGTTASVGALTLTHSDAESLAPILAATAVVALLNVNPLARVERGLRGMAHDIAGIPRHLQQIIVRLPGLFEQGAGRSSNEIQPTDELPLAERLPALPGSDIIAIRYYQQCLFGKIGADLWTGRSAYLLEKARPALQDDYRSLTRSLNRQRSGEAPLQDTEDDSQNDEIGTNDRQSLELLARSLRVRYASLLAVAIINEPASHRPASTPDALWALVEQARSELASSVMLGVLATGTLAGFVICLVYTTLAYLTAAVATLMNPASLSLDTADSQLLVNGLSMGFFYMSSLESAFNAALWDVSGLCLLFLFGSGAGLVFRGSRQRNLDWSRWENGVYPVVQYAIVSLLAMASAAFAYVLFLFIRLVAWPSGLVQIPGHFASMLKDFGNGYVQFGFICVLAAPCAILVCLLSDRLEQDRSDSRKHDPAILLMIASFAIVSGIALPLLVRMQIGDLHQFAGALLASAVPIGAIIILSVSFWFVGHAVPQPGDEVDVSMHGGPIGGPTIRRASERNRSDHPDDRPLDPSSAGKSSRADSTR